jgi:hypothetical protein
MTTHVGLGVTAGLKPGAAATDEGEDRPANPRGEVPVAQRGTHAATDDRYSDS